jgi:hypothetical protein
MIFRVAKSLLPLFRHTGPVSHIAAGIIGNAVTGITNLQNSVENESLRQGSGI